MHRWRAICRALLLVGLLPMQPVWASPPAYPSIYGSRQETGPLHTARHGTRVSPNFFTTDTEQSLGSFQLLVVPVAYSDRPFGTQTARTTDIQAYLADMVFGTDATGEGLYPYPSMRQYYLDQSRGQFLLDGEVAPTVTLTGTTEHYATYNNGSANGCYGLGTYFADGSLDSAQNGGTSLLMQEVLTELDGRGVDLTQYMNRADGTLDGIIFIHVGAGGETASSAHDAGGCSNPAGAETIWSHVLDREITVNSAVYSTSLLISAETFLDARNGSRELPSGIGTLAHEFGHVLGLPDLYDTSSTGSGYGVGQYSIMGHGLYDTAAIAADAAFGPDFRPKNLDPYLRAELSWIETPLLTDNRCFEQLRETPNADSVWKVGPEGSTEYFLLEFRGQQGWDAELPAQGLLVWHIDESKRGQKDNCIPGPGDSCRFSHYEVSVVQRDGRYGLESRESWMDAGDYYIPGTYLDEQTVPGFVLYDGSRIEAQASVLEVTDAVLIAHLAGDPDSLPEAPERIGPQPAMQAAVGVEYSWDATVDSDGLPVHFSLLESPQGMTVDARLGQLRWTPVETGQATFTLTAQSCSGSIGRTVTVAVAPSSAFLGSLDGLEIGGGCSASRAESERLIGGLLAGLGLWLIGVIALRRRIA